MNSRRRHPPFCNIDCQSLLGLEVNYFGWLRSQAIMNSWSKKFVVLIKGHVYIFKNENSTNHMKEFSFSLYGFKSVEQPILKENERLWILKLVHTDEARSKIFRASTEPDLNMWTEKFKDGIVFANTAQNRQSYAQWPNNSDSGFYNYGGRHYQDGRRGYEQLSTHNEEEPIHQSYSEMSLPQNNSDLYEEVNRTTEVTRPTEVTRQTNCPPELPPRPRSYLDLDKAADDAKKSTNATNIKKNQASQPESSSEYEEDYENDSYDSDASYENTSDNQNCYLSVQGGAGSFHDQHEEKIELFPGSAYIVISTTPYKAASSDELSFEKDVKFVVVGRETKRWHIGRIGRKKGFFPAECVKIIQLSELQKYLHSLLCQKEKTFEILLIFSILLKASIIKPEDWLLTIIEHQHRMACYMLLAYMTVTEKRKEDIILPALKMAIEKGAINIAKSISSYIIRDLWRSSKFDIDLILDIWPAVVCKNTNCSKVKFCSTDMVIMIETKQSTKDLPITFWNIEIKYISQRSEFKTKKQMKEQRCCKAHHNVPKVKSILENFEIDGHLASNLFKMHSKLTCICKSVYKSKDCKRIKRACVQLFCRGKGFIPVGENHFPKFVNEVETDVLEGEPVLAARLRVGEKVNSKYLSGTLGGFVKVFGDITFLTCAHVVMHEDNLSGTRLTFPSNEPVYMSYVRPLPTSTDAQNSEISLRCGKLRYIEFRTDRPGETSIDAALIKLQKGIEIDMEHFIANIRNQQHNLQFHGIISPFLNDNCIDSDKMFHGISFRQFDNVTFGATSGLSSNISTMHMPEEKEEGIHVDREPIMVTYKKVVESENQASSNSCLFSSGPPIFSNNAHLQETRLKKVDKQRTLRRLSRCMYNQISVTQIPFQPGDSGTCIYVRDNSLNVFGCIGMAIANHPDLAGGVIVTPMKDILKTFHVDIH